MKIAHLISQFYPYIGGAEICIHNVCCKLAEQGHEAVVITTSAKPDKIPDLPYEVFYLSSRTGGFFRRAPKLAKLYLRQRISWFQNKYGFDLWQVTMGYPLGIYSVSYFIRNHIPCILRCCGEDIQKYPEIKYGYRLDKKVDDLVRKRYPFFDGHVALTPSVMQEYSKLGIPSEKIRIIPNGVDIKRFGKIKMDVLCPQDSRKQILTVGRYHPKKGFDNIPAIARVLKSKGLDFEWTIVGKKCDELLRKYPECRELGIKTVEKFAFTGGDIFSLPSEGLVRLYCSADIFVLPTLIETFGMVLIEAMAAGLPIVTTEAPGVRDVVKNEINGLKVSPGDIEGIADAVFRVLNDDNLSERLQRNALKSSENYDWDKVVSDYISFYEEIINIVGK